MDKENPDAAAAAADDDDDYDDDDDDDDDESLSSCSQIGEQEGVEFPCWFEVIE